MAEIKVYSTPTCPWCKKLKALLNEKGVKYEDIDVSANQEAAKDMVEKSGQMGVPQIEINGEIIVGFDQEKIEEALEKLDGGAEKKEKSVKKEEKPVKEKERTEG